MSKEITSSNELISTPLAHARVTLVQFYGGQTLGQCVQITQQTEHGLQSLQLTREHARALSAELARFGDSWV